uniref:RPA-interacting protein C-terminal domain-containing protein n=1 Tax=Plectus sambesii TaxID=2011161 RepID=A0A914XDH8_9BILA
MTSAHSSNPVSPLCERFSQYKIKSPAWKPMFRAACMQRMRASRSQYTNRLRDIDGEAADSGRRMEVDKKMVIDQVMNEELTKLRNSEKMDDDEFNLCMSIYEEIRREMYEEEQALADEFVEFEQQRLDAELASFTDDNVICPHCLHGNLQFDERNSFRCPNCEFIFIFENNIGPSREAIRECFSHAFTSHAAGDCPSQPIVSQVASTDGRAQRSLLLSCNVCSYVHVMF